MTELVLAHDLAHYESVIERGLQTFVDVGNALLAIRDNLLYRNRGYKSFDDYCRERWQFERHYANRLIASAKAVKNITDGAHGHQKLNISQIDERKIRPLTRIKEPERQREAWQRAVETAPNGKPTGEHIKRVVAEMVREPAPQAVVLPAPRSPRLVVAHAEKMPQVTTESVDLIITSPPYNLGGDSWPMGGNGRTGRPDGIGYRDTMSENDYQMWQLDCLIEMYRVAKRGASLFYNHKVRSHQGEMIHPLDWLRNTFNPWTIRQEIIWDRGSTHNHSASLFWPEDERIYWMTKGKPELPNRPLGKSTVWHFHGPAAGTWHPAPFSEELPRRCIEAIGQDNIIVLDPFAGSCTTLKVALEYGYNAIGVDISQQYLEQARQENGWTNTSKT